MKNAVQLEGVSKRFGAGPAAVDALRGLSLAVSEGAAAVVAGPSGSGKTTLLNIVGALEKPDAGVVTALGIALSALGERALSRHRRAHIGFVFQESNLLSDLTARENVELPLILNRMPKRDRARRVAELVARLGIAERQGAFPGGLSAGERQRFAIARAVAHRPALLIADEPTANLDTVQTIEVIRLLDELHQQERITVLIATHDRRVIDAIPSRVYLRDGAIEGTEGPGVGVR